MASAKGCFKNGCLGCLGLVILLLIIGGIGALVGLRDTRDAQPIDTVLSPDQGTEQSGALALGKGGTVRLNLSEGEFILQPADAGEGLRVEAVYDDAMFDLQQDFTSRPDSTWQYVLGFHKTDTGSRGFWQSIFHKGPKARLKIHLPPDVPIELIAEVAKGGLDAELGGLWLRSADLKARMGGFALSIAKPLREPMTSCRIRTAMGGLSVEGLGNASPGVLAVHTKMGGGDISLDGLWQNDCQIDLTSRMGGMSVSVPENVKLVRGAGDALLAPTETSGELPVLRLHSTASMGEIDIAQ